MIKSLLQILKVDKKNGIYFPRNKPGKSGPGGGGASSSRSRLEQLRVSSEQTAGHDRILADELHTVPTNGPALKGVVLSHTWARALFACLKSLQIHAQHTDANTKSKYAPWSNVCLATISLARAPECVFCSRISTPTTGCSAAAAPKRDGRDAVLCKTFERLRMWNWLLLVLGTSQSPASQPASRAGH